MTETTTPAAPSGTVGANVGGCADVTVECRANIWCPLCQKRTPAYFDALACSGMVPRTQAVCDHCGALLQIEASMDVNVTVLTANARNQGLAPQGEQHE